MTSTTIKSWKYAVPTNCYRATEWCGSECISGEITIMANEKVIRFRGSKKDVTLDYSISPDTIYKVEDSSRYFVFLAEGRPTGFGFKSREESKIFIDSIKDIVPHESLKTFMRRERDRINTVLQKQQKVIDEQGHKEEGGGGGGGNEKKKEGEEEKHDDLNNPNVEITEGMVRRTRASRAPLPERPLTLKTGETGAAPLATQPQEENQHKSKRKHVNEDWTQEKWHSHKKHMFMLSTSGKPIYSRYGDEQEMSSLTGLMYGFFSFVRDSGNDTLRYFVAGDHKFVFYVHGPVILACICSTGEPLADLRRQMYCMYQQISMLLSSKIITRYLDQRPSNDLRTLMSGSDFSLLDYVVHSCNSQPSTIFDAYQPLPLPKDLRSAINDKIVTGVAPCKSVLFTLLFMGHELIHLGSQPRLMLDSVDLQTLMNFVSSTKALGSNRTWTPLCLPMFDDSSFVHGYIWSITDVVTLVIISQHADAFYAINKCADVIVNDFKSAGVLQSILTPPRIDIKQLGIHSLIHFAFVARGYRQVVVPPFSTPEYKDDPKAQKRIYRAYKSLRASLEITSPNLVSMSGSDLGPHSFLYKAVDGKTFIVWSSKMFELYAAFSVIKSKSQAVSACNNIIKFILKGEDTYFITSHPMLK